MEERKYTVYAHINKENLKVYVGQTGQRVQRRWRNGESYLRNNEGFANDIKKYGWENFEHVILEEGLTKFEADFYEKMYIKEFKSTNIQYGYNLTFGGATNEPTEATREKIKLNHAHLSGEKASMYGKHIKDFMTPDAYERWLENKRKYGATHRGGNNPNAKKVYCYEKDKTYDSLVDAAEDCNINISCISSCISGKVMSAGYDQQKGLYLHWCWAEDKDAFIPPPQEQSLSLGKYHWSAKKIYCFELDETFYGTGEVRRKYNINAKVLDKCLRGERHSCGKHPITGELLHWCYDEDKDNFIVPDPKASKNLGKYHHSAKAVYCIELDEIFDTAVEAHKKYGFSKQHIGAVCRGQRNYTGLHPQTKEKLHWMFLTDAIEQKKISKDKIQEYELK